MQLAISNIAWPAEWEEEIAGRLCRLGAEGVEIAPTKIWPEPLSATPAEIHAYRRFWEQRGLRIVALQSLLFGKPDLQLFQSADQRRATVDYLSGMMAMAARLGAEALVFGSPKNRLVGELAPELAWKIALDVFGQLGRIAQRHGVWFCIEPNPVCYGCDFVTTAADGLRLVQEVDQTGFGLHLDAAGMTLSGDAFDPQVIAASRYWRHFHISEPYLEPIGTRGAPHSQIARWLEGANYHGWRSIEMKGVSADETLEHVEAALEFCARHYFAKPQSGASSAA